MSARWVRLFPVPGWFYSPARGPCKTGTERCFPPAPTLGVLQSLDLSPSRAEPIEKRRGERGGAHVTKTTVPSGPRELEESCRQDPVAAGSAVSPMLGHSLPPLLCNTGNYWVLQLPPDFQKGAVAGERGHPPGAARL